MQNRKDQDLLERDFIAVADYYLSCKTLFRSASSVYHRHLDELSKIKASITVKEDLIERLAVIINSENSQIAQKGLEEKERLCDALAKFNVKYLQQIDRVDFFEAEYLAIKKVCIQAKEKLNTHPLATEMNQRVADYHAERHAQQFALSEAYYLAQERIQIEKENDAVPASLLDLKHVQINAERQNKHNHPDKYKNGRTNQHIAKSPKQTDYAYHKLSMFDRKGFGAKANIKRQLVEHEKFLEGMNSKKMR